jgi:hypothetical protein
MPVLASLNQIEFMQMLCCQHLGPHPPPKPLPPQQQSRSKGHRQPHPPPKPSSHPRESHAPPKPLPPQQQSRSKGIRQPHPPPKPPPKNPSIYIPPFIGYTLLYDYIGILVTVSGVFYMHTFFSRFVYKY